MYNVFCMGTYIVYCYIGDICMYITCMRLFTLWVHEASRKWVSTHENEQTLKHSFRAAANATRQLEITRNQSKTSKNSGQVKQPTGVCNPTTATATATATATTPPPLCKPLSLFGSRSGRSCRTKGFKLLVETTSSASFEWMATNGWARRRTNRRKEQKRKGWRGWGGCMGMGMMMWMWGQVERRQRRQRLILRFVFALPWASSGCRTHTYTNRHTHTHTHREDVRELCAECQPSNANAGAERRQLENLFNCWQFN